MSRDITIPPSGAAPGQAGKILTILALTESGSFTDHEQESLLTKITVSSTDPGLSPQVPDEPIRKSSPTRKCNVINTGVIICLWIAYVLCNAAYSMMSPFFPQIAKGRGASSLMIGVVLSSAPLSVVLLSPLFGYVLPHIKVWCQVLFGLLLVGASYIALGFATNVPTEWGFTLTCVALRLCEGIGTAILTTAIFSTFPRLCPKYVGTLVGLFELAAGIGYMMGPTVGGALFQVGGYKLPFLSAGGCILLFTIPCTFLLLLLRKISFASEKKTLPLRVICSVLTNVPFVVLVMVVAISYNPFSFVSPSLSIFLNEEYHQSVLQIGVLFFIGSVAYMVSAFPVGPITDRIGRHRWFTVFGMVLIILGYLLIIIPYYMGLRNMWAFRVGYGIVAVGDAVCVVPIYASLLAIGKRYMQPDDNMAALSSFVSGLITSAGSFGLFLGPLVGGVVTTYLPFPVCVLLLSELLTAQALLLTGLSLIEKYVI